jgi:hypothetical protein
VCKTSCVTTTDCTTGDYCSSGSCVPAQALGATCTATEQCASGFCTDGVCCSVATCGTGAACAGPGAQAGKCLRNDGSTCASGPDCASGHCTDGVCCDKPCDGQCEACDVAGSSGTCTPVTGKPHGARAVCDALADNDCGHTSCDGATRDKCDGFANGATTACGVASCTADRKLQKPGTCDGHGGCSYPDPASCVEYACDSTTLACHTSCASDDDCGPDFKCDPASKTCIQGATCSADGTSSVSKTGTVTSCAPYACGSEGACLGSCNGQVDCIGGTVCDQSNHACIETTTQNGASCATQSPGSERAPAWLVAAAIGAVVARIRRRR